MADLSQDFYESLSPKQRKSLKSSSGWLVEGEVDTTDASPRANQKVTLIGESEQFNNTLLGPVPAGVGIEFTTFVTREEEATNGSLITGDKSDTIIGSGNLTGIALGEGTSISTNGGNDTLNGTGGSTGYGIFVNGAIIDTGSDTGPDNDTINGSGGQAGIAVLFGSEIFTDSEEGSGNDSITGVSEGVLGVSGGIGIQLGGGQLGSEVLLGGDGFIDTGLGNDSVIGDGVNAGIFVSDGSVLSTGAGEDTVDAEKGGFAGSGLIDLGADNDTLIGGGFGSGITFDGGVGEDKVVLGDGTYTYGDDDDGFGPYLSDGLDRMSIVDFELISGTAGIAEDGSGLNATSDGSQALVPLGEYTIQNGHLIV